MVIPEWFEEALRTQFGGKFLVRWSHARHCFVIDEKISRGVAITPHRLGKKLEKKLPEVRDEYLFRLRNGTEPYVEVFPGNQAPCPRCGSKVLLRSREWIFAHCDRCQKDFKAVHYELSEMLLEALRYQDIYEHGAEDRLIADMDRANEAKEKSDKRADRNILEAAVKEDWKDINSIGRSTRPA